MNHNVRLSLLYNFTSAVARGMYGFAVLSGLLYNITDGSNSKVGFAEGLQGATQVLFAIPIGCMVDKCGRAWTLRFAGFVGYVAIGLMMLILYLHEDFIQDHLFEFMTAGLCFLGVYQAMWRTALETIFADSVSSEDRTKYTTWKFMLGRFGITAGPIFAIILFTIWGDSWTFRELRDTFAVGYAFGVIPATILLFFDESKLLGKESEAIFTQDNEAGRAVVTHENGTAQEKDNPWIKRIPYLVLMSDFVIAIGSGMTIKFFPLFFKNEVLLTPIQVNLIYVTNFTLMGFWAWGLEKLSKRIGRIPSILLSAATGLACLFTMGFFKASWTQPWTIIPIYVVRTIMMNATRGLRKAILMDVVKKEDRGKWNAVDSVTSFGWSGSAFLGGYLVDKYGYGYTFVITASIQAIGYIPWIVIHCVLPRKREKPKGQLTEPLIN